MNQKSVGIITICKVNNYGAELQAYALQKKISDLGFSTEIIDYLYYIHPKHKKEVSSRPGHVKNYPLVRRIKSWLFPKIELMKSCFHRNESKIRKMRFENFHKENTKFSRIFDRYSTLYLTPPSYDIYCVGSDQVWNPYSFTSLDPYFLTFAPTDKVRFAYASSFGVSNVPESSKEYYCKQLNGLDLISVREKTGGGIVKTISGRTAENVVDPTLLLDSQTWISISSDKCVPASKYILLYVLKDTPYITDLALRIGKELNLSIVRICRNAYRQDKKKSPILNIMDAGPAEFLGLFRNAELVLTNSFHGTVFSVLFNRDFYTIVSKGKDTNSRQIDLLTRLGIDRIRYANDDFVYAKEIDWNSVDENINKLRESSLNFLHRALNYEK